MTDTFKKPSKVLAAVGVILSLIATIFSLWLLSLYTPSLLPNAPQPVGDSTYGYARMLIVTLYLTAVLAAVVLGFLAMRHGPAYAQVSFLTLMSILTLASGVSAYMNSRTVLPEYYLEMFLIQATCLSTGPAIGLFLTIRHIAQHSPTATAKSRQRAD